VTEKLVTKSVRLTDSEGASLREICKQTGLSGAAMMKQWIQEGLLKYKLDKAIAAYSTMEMSLGEAADYAGINKVTLIHEIGRRGLGLIGGGDMFLEDMRTVADVLGDPHILEVAKQVDQEFRQVRAQRAAQVAEEGIAYETGLHTMTRDELESLVRDCVDRYLDELGLRPKAR